MTFFGTSMLPLEETSRGLYDFSLPFRCCMLLESIGLFLKILHSSLTIFSSLGRVIALAVLSLDIGRVGLVTNLAPLNGVGLVSLLRRSLSKDLFYDLMCAS